MREPGIFLRRKAREYPADMLPRACYNRVTESRESCICVENLTGA